MVPEEFVGVWRRVSLQVGDEPPDEPHDVWWLQTASCFADLRTVRGTGGSEVVEAFAGTTSWSPPALSWAHELDWHGGFATTDTGTVEWLAGGPQPAFLERGEFGGPGGTRYEEHWELVPSPGPVTALRGHRYDVTALYVAIGDHSLLMAAAGERFAVRLGLPGARTLELGDGTLLAGTLHWDEVEAPAGDPQPL
ncbi:MAG: hypothetical protein ACOYOP_11565 [Microthrixaceae bacterium]